MKQTTLKFSTNYGDLSVEMLEVPGTEPEPARACAEVNAFMLMFDVTTRLSYANVVNWYHKSQGSGFY